MGSEDPLAHSPFVVSGKVSHALLDTSVVLDVLLIREPWLSDAKPLWDAQNQEHLVAYVTASSVTDIFYISRKIVGISGAQTIVARCLHDFEIIDVNHATLIAALALPGSDFEDNLQIACAQHESIDFIVTRDIKGFAKSPLPVFLPDGQSAS